ncbi:hypothetical protein KSP39_PZI012255 [Platanthera zijinensis]|uniref:Uncharacterized protein n=1 Tax=Platanthera zijinensis TaxID=2320716 RepID=A0AAP0BI71_9ASPA
MALVMKQQNRPEEAIEAIKSPPSSTSTSSVSTLMEKPPMRASFQKQSFSPETSANSLNGRKWQKTCEQQ